MTDDRRWEVVRNDGGQFSVWPAGRRRPPGWHPDGISGTEDECLDHIERVWVDITPIGSR